MTKTILYNLLGTTLDQRFGKKRWNNWRPSVAICQHDDLLIDEYHLIYPTRFKKLADVVSEDIKQVSPHTKVILQALDFNNPWDFEEVYSGLSDHLGQNSFSSEKNNYLFHITTGTHVAQICIFLLTESRFFPGKLLQTSPDKTNDNVRGSYTIIDLDLSKYDKIASRFADQIKNDISFLKSGIETKNKAFNNLIEKIELISLRSTEPILLTGPTGAGKSHLAGKIYELKKTHALVTGKFIEINCATLRGDQAMSTLFGHKKGAFTGATTDRPGLLKAADNGIVFLDEIGELGADEQAMLLRAIEEKKFMSVGADTETSSNFQLICGTNHNLQQKINQGLFREDLLARINLWTFCLPGLKQRPEDIEPNIAYELKRFTKLTGNTIRFNKEAKTKFLNFAISPEASWNSNFRDLNGAITRMCTLANNGRITNDIVKEELKRLTLSWGHQSSSSDKPPAIIQQDEWEKLDPFDQIQLNGVLKICKQSHSLSEAGRQLFAISRLTKNKPNDADRLKKYLARFNIKWDDVKKKQ